MPGGGGDGGGGSTASGDHAPADVFIPAIADRIAAFLPPNEVACALRCVTALTAQLFADRAAVRLSQPCPTWAFAARWSAPGACLALSYKHRLQLLCLTAASADVANLEAALAATGLCMTGELMAAAAAAGRLHVCRWLAKRGCPLDGAPYLALSPLAAAAQGGHAEVCKWLLEQGCAWHDDCVRCALRGGHVPLMRDLLAARPGADTAAEDLIRAAAEGCDLPTLQALWGEWAAQSNPAQLLHCTNTAAARSPTPDWAAKVAWLLKQGAPRPEAACAAAASLPDGVARLTLLTGDMGLPTTTSTVAGAAGTGQAGTLRWLLARGVRPAAGEPPARVATGGHTEVLRVLHAAGCELPPPRLLLRAACASGSVDTVAWVLGTVGAEALQEEGPFAFDAALESGSLELVAWLGERGVAPGRKGSAPGPAPWSSAAEGGCVAVLEWLAGWGVAMQEIRFPPGHPYVTAAIHGDLLTLEALRRLGLPLGRTEAGRRGLATQAIACQAPLPALRWLRQAGCGVDWAGATDAACSGFKAAGWRAEVLAWLQAEA